MANPYREEATVKKQIRLGDVARDGISGFEGVVVARTEWLHNCVRLTIQPQTLHDGKPIDAFSFDEPQCLLVKETGAYTSEARTGGPRPEPNRR
jgi:hypothetical protein